MQLTLHPYSGLTKSAGWAVTAYDGSRDGNVIQTTVVGKTIQLTATNTDFYLIYAPHNYTSRLQVNVDGTDVGIIDLKGEVVTQWESKETITVQPIVTGLSLASHTITLTTLDNVTYSIDSIESKNGTLTLDNTSILDTGDSITDYGDNTTGWCTLLAQYLNRTLYDVGLGGATYDQIAIHFWDYIKNRASIPSIVTVMGGANDIITYSQNDQIFVSRRIISILNLILSLSSQVEIRLGEVTYIGGNYAVSHPGIDAICEQWNVTIDQIAKDYKVKLAKTHQAYHSDSYSNDGVHPNVSGNQKLFEAFRDASIPLISNEEPMYFGAPFGGYFGQDVVVTPVDITVTATIDIPVSINMDIFPVIAQLDLSITALTKIPTSIRMGINSTLQYVSLPLAVKVPMKLRSLVNMLVLRYISNYHSTSTYRFREIPNQYTFIEITTPYNSKEIVNQFTWKGVESMYQYLLGEKKPVQVEWARKDGKPFAITSAVYSFESTVDGPMSIDDKTTLINLEPASIGTKYCKIEVVLTPTDSNLPVENHIAEVQVVVRPPKVA